MVQNVVLFGTHVTVDVISWGHIRVRWSPNPIWLCLYEQEIWDTDTHRENVMWTLKLCCHQPRNYQKLKESLTRAFPPASEAARPCWPLGFGLGLQNIKKIKFCCLKPPTLWYLVTVALTIYIQSIGQFHWLYIPMKLLGNSFLLTWVLFPDLFPVRQFLEKY